MQTNDRFQALLNADEKTLEKIDSILEGKGSDQAPATIDRRLLMMGEAAKVLNVSRSTIHRMIRDGLLATVELREGTLRIPSQVLTDFVNQKRKAS